MKIDRSGFTLIELIVAIAVSSILVWQGFVRYQEFKRKQEVKQAALEYVSTLRTAQNQAVTGDKPAGCSDLFSGFRVSPTLNSNQFRVSAICNGSEFASQTKTIRSALVDFVTPSQQTTFLPIYGTATAATVTLRHEADASLVETIAINEGGSISCSSCD